MKRTFFEDITWPLTITTVVIVFGLWAWGERIKLLEQRISSLENQVHSLEFSRSIQSDIIDSMVTDLQRVKR